MSKSYEVGYGKPPKKSQFKKGQSGNPNGRPPSDVSFQAILRRVLDKSVVAKTTSGEIRMTQLEVILQQFVSKAANGNVTAAKLLFQELSKAGFSEPQAVGGVLLMPAPYTEQTTPLEIIDESDEGDDTSCDQSTPLLN